MIICCVDVVLQLVVRLVHYLLLLVHHALILSLASQKSSGMYNTENVVSILN